MGKAELGTLISQIEDIVTKNRRIGADELVECLLADRDYKGRASKNDIAWSLTDLLSRGRVKYDEESYLTPVG